METLWFSLAFSLIAITTEPNLLNQRHVPGGLQVQSTDHNLAQKDIAPRFKSQLHHSLPTTYFPNQVTHLCWASVCSFVKWTMSFFQLKTPSSLLKKKILLRGQVGVRFLFDYEERGMLLIISGVDYISYQ
jgi:hypothetical protein